MSEEIKQKEIKKFLNSYDFMKLGQAVNRGQWETAMMIVSRMERKEKELGLGVLEKNLRDLKYAVLSRSANTAKNILALVIQKRIRLQNQMKAEERHIGDPGNCP